MLDQGCNAGNNLGASEQPILVATSNDTAPPPEDAASDAVEAAYAAWEYELEDRLIREEALMQAHYTWLCTEQERALRRHAAIRAQHLRPQPSRRRHIARMREKALDGAGIEWRIIRERYPRDKHTPRQRAGL